MGNALLTMYAKFGRLDFALQVFDQMPVRNVVSWTSVISAYMKNGHIDAACQVFQSMEFEGVQPNEVTLVCMLSVCTALECLELGQRFHDYVVQFDFELVAAINNSLMDMYMKCGNLEEAYHVLSKQSSITWAPCTADYGLQHEDYKAAMDMG
jgi:pentatricopeptide repeat protein